MVKELIYQFNTAGIDGFIATAFVIIMSAVSALFYNHKGKLYIKNKQGHIKSPSSFRFVYRYIQLTTIIASIGSFLTDYPPFLELHDKIFLLYLGISISTVAMALFISAKLSLGEHYSPCFDSYIPRDIVQEGLYRYIRHPIYASNILLLIGVFIASGSLWILINIVLLGIYYVNSALREELILLEKFPIYSKYSTHTNRFIPLKKSSFKS